MRPEGSGAGSAPTSDQKSRGSSNNGTVGGISDESCLVWGKWAGTGELGKG